MCSAPTRVHSMSLALRLRNAQSRPFGGTAEALPAGSVQEAPHCARRSYGVDGRCRPSPGHRYGRTRRPEKLAAPSKRAGIEFSSDGWRGNAEKPEGTKDIRTTDHHRPPHNVRKPVVKRIHGNSVWGGRCAGWGQNEHFTAARVINARSSQMERETAGRRVILASYNIYMSTESEARTDLALAARHLRPRK